MKKKWLGGMVALMCMLPGHAFAGGTSPDKIYYNGEILTLEDSGLIQEAVSVRNGRIQDVGLYADVQATASDKTEMIDLKGQTLLPGFIDPHSHFAASGYGYNTYVMLYPPPIGTIDSMDTLIEALKERVKENRGQVVLGRGYDDTLLKEMRHPTREDLDKASKDVPIVITHISGHVRVANSKALEIAGVDAKTVAPAGGNIQKFKDGKPNGILEGLAWQFVSIPELELKQTEKETIAGIKRASDEWSRKGFTMGADNISNAGLFDTYRKALHSGDLYIRMNGWPRTSKIADNDQFPTTKSGADVSGDNSLMVIQGFHKNFVDGSPQGYTANFTQPYSTQRPQDDGAYKGFPVYKDKGEWVRYITELHRDGWQIAIHSNGDQAIQDTIDAYSYALKKYPREDHRHVIIHNQFVRPDQLDQIAALGVSPNFFIGHTFYWGDRHRDIFFGADRAAHMSPLKAARDRGIRFTTHTDTYVTPIDGIQMIWSSVNRVSSSGKVIGPEHRITPLDAIKAITKDAAWQYQLEDQLGTIAPGKLADFVILSENPLSVGHLDPLKIKDITVNETIVGGKTVFKGETKSIIAEHYDRKK